MPGILTPPREPGVGRFSRWATRRLALVVLVATAVVAAAAPAGAGAAQFRYSHRITISGQMVDNWNVGEQGLCGTNGGGSLS